VTSHTDEIHKLIADIDHLLVNSGNPLSKLLSGQGHEERDILQRVRNFLVKLQDWNETETVEEITPNSSQSAPLSSLLTRYVEQDQNQAVSRVYQSQQQSINPTVEQFKDEIEVVLQPLKAELSGLLEERASLIQEIRQLEQKRLQNYSLTQQLANQEQIINEFVQVLINRLVPNLIPYLTSNVINASNLTRVEHQPEVSQDASQSALESYQGIEKFNLLARDLDQRLLSLDGTVNVVFEALERNINTYYQSLSQALNRMHSQGLQGEQLMVNFLQHLQNFQNLYHQNLPQQSLNIPGFTDNIDGNIYSATEAPNLTAIEEDFTTNQVSDQQETETLKNADNLILEMAYQEPLNVVENNFDIAPTEEVTTIQVSEQPVGEQPVSEQPVSEQAATEIIKDLDTVLSQLSVQEPLEMVQDNFQSSITEEVTTAFGSEQQATEIIEGLDTVLSQLNVQEPLNVLENNWDSFSNEQLNTTQVVEQEEPEIIENLDILLSEINAQRASASESQNFDEVDELYASLFGGADANIATEEPILPQVTSDVGSADASEMMSASTGTEAQENNLLISSDLIEQENVENLGNVENLENLENLGNLENLNIVDQNQASLPEIDVAFVENTEQPADLWEKPLLPEDTPSEAEFASIPLISDSRPDSSDIITVLTDLLVDVSNEEQAIETLDREVLAVEEEIKTSAQQIPIVDSAQETKPVQDLPQNNYITASPQEDLLSLENSDLEAEGIPNIVLDQAQLEQLDRDLASFDWRLNSEPLQTITLNNSETPAPDVVSENQGMLDIEMPWVEPANDSKTENVPLADVADLVSDLYGVPNAQKNQSINSQAETGLRVDDNLNNNLDNNSSDNSGLRIEDVNAVWYLGIDLGTTGISAALLNRSRLVVYPIYWSAETKSGENSFEQSFRLPAEVYLPTASIPQLETESTDSLEQRTPAAVAGDKTRSASAPAKNLYSANLKPFLQVAIPYKTRQQKWEPVLQLNEYSAGPLIWVVRSLSKLLLTLKSDQTSTTPALIAHGMGIDKQTFSQIIDNLAGVICNCPANWSEQYRFNVREAILNSQLVSHAQQIFFVEEAIASLLPELDPGNFQSVQLAENQGLRPLKTSENPLRGNTLTLNIGATATEMALVDLSTDLSQLTYRDFMLHSFTYGGKAMEQDIICQLLLPPKSRQPRGIQQTANQSYSRSWQPAIPGLDQVKWSSLNLQGLEIPRVGEPDVVTRIRLQQRLEGSLLGQGLLDAAVALKFILQHQESFILELADQCWLLQRRDLETQIFVPYVRRLNRELNKLLVARGTPTEAINQAILSGGVASVATVNRWLRQKLPNAKIIQDLYLGDNGTPRCSRIAYGLTMLPLYPQFLEIPKHQYTDYFLFTELLKILSDHFRGQAIRSLSFGEILQLFESRGINTRICQQRLLAFLEGELPAGLVPVISETSPDHEENQVSVNSMWLTQKSQENPDYQAIASTPLFEKQGNLTYRHNPQQLLVLHRYLESLTSSTLQSLAEPLAVNFPVSANPQ
jgi:hypothetical protein